MSDSDLPPPDAPKAQPGSPYATKLKSVISPVYKRMDGRDDQGDTRISTPLELLYDLSLIVAVSAVSEAFAGAIISNTSLSESTAKFCMSFYLVWAAWSTFCWFANLNDVDDVLFRIGAFGQILGILLISSGVPSLFSYLDLTQITIGYVIVRFFDAFFYKLRAAWESASKRKSNWMQFIVSITLPCIWLLRLLVPKVMAWTVVSFTACVLLELLGPYLASAGADIEGSIHPYHIGDRYASFTIVIMGECVISIGRARSQLDPSNDANTSQLELAMILIGELIMIFLMWWMYFAVPFGHFLALKPNKGFFWGYSHILIHLSLGFVASSMSICTTARDAGTKAMGIQILAIAVCLNSFFISFVVSILMHFRRNQAIVKALGGTLILVVAYVVAPVVGTGASLLLMCIPLALVNAYVLYDIHTQFGKFKVVAPQSNYEVVDTTLALPGIKSHGTLADAIE